MNKGVGAADDEGKVASGEDAGDDGGGMRTEGSRGNLAGKRVEIAKEMVGDGAAVGERELVSGDVEAPVELHFVGIDDLGREAGGEVDGEGGLAGAGSAKEEEEGIGGKRGENKRASGTAGKRKRVGERKGKCHRIGKRGK